MSAYLLITIALSLAAAFHFAFGDMTGPGRASNRPIACKARNGSVNRDFG